MILLGRQPAFWLGLIATIVVGIVQTLAGQGVVSEATSGKVVDMTQAAVNLLTLMAPLLAGLAIHTQVTPTIAPVLSVGTSVTTPQGTSAQVTAGPDPAVPPNPPTAGAKP
jgi:hypothetical protein